MLLYFFGVFLDTTQAEIPLCILPRVPHFPIPFILSFIKPL